MKIKETELKGLLIIEPTIFGDERGYFLETFNKLVIEAQGYPLPTFIQDNESLSRKDVVRGLHFQAKPHTQAKLVRVVKGAVKDVCVDVRPESSTFGKHIIVDLSEHDKRMVFIPAGFAHGIRTLHDDTILCYKCSQPYEKSAERTIIWNDPQLAIDWGIADPVVSEKDRAGISWNEMFPARTPATK